MGGTTEEALPSLLGWRGLFVWAAGHAHMTNVREEEVSR